MEIMKYLGIVELVIKLVKCTLSWVFKFNDQLELGTPMVGYSKLAVDMSVVFLLYVSFSCVLQLN